MGYRRFAREIGEENAILLRFGKLNSCEDSIYGSIAETLCNA